MSPPDARRRSADATARPGSPRAGGRVPSLDGLRAVSISLVLLGHLSGTRGFGTLQLGVGDYAHLAVIVFFVISGFLITRLLLHEQEESGRVSLKNFYLRRTLRLFPASYAYIACIAVLGLVGLVRELDGHQLWHAATYTVNHLSSPNWDLGHLWSLSIEEQFYLLWPLAFVALGPKKAMGAAAAILLLGPVARSAGWLFLRGTAWQDLNLFPMVADSLATGCLMARVSGWLERQGWYLRLFRPINSLLLLGTILLINRYLDYTIVRVAGTSVINVCAAILIHRSAFCHADGVGKVLNSRPLVLIGGLSYSLYVWQQPFLNRHSQGWAAAFPQNLILAVCVAVASYQLLEKPLLRLRHGLRS